MQPWQLRVHAIPEGAGSGVATRLHGVDVLTHHTQDACAVLVPRGHVRLDGLIGQPVVGLDGRPVDRIEDRVLAPLNIRPPHTEGGHRIRDE